MKTTVLIRFHSFPFPADSKTGEPVSADGEDEMKPAHIELTELQYSTDIHGTLAIYIYDEHGRHRGPTYFNRKIKRAEGEIPLDYAQLAAQEAIKRGLEVRITNGGDHLVFHAKGGNVLYPQDASDFWERACR